MFDLNSVETNKLSFILRALKKEAGRIGTAFIVEKESALEEAQKIVNNRRRKKS